MEISLSKKSCEECKKKLNEIKKNIKNIDLKFMELSYEWIINEANSILDLSINDGYKIVTNIRESWNKEINDNVLTIYNSDGKCAFVEFGTGYVGENKPHKESKNANYQYNIPSDKKDENGYWTFMLDNGSYITFRGYEGKAYLYKAFRKYIDNKIYIELYNKAFEEINGELLK